MGDKVHTDAPGHLGSIEEEEWEEEEWEGGKVVVCMHPAESSPHE